MITQLRTQQVTGSVSDQRALQAGGFASITNDVNDGNLAAVLDHMASSLKRLHGFDSAIENSAAQVKSAGLFTVDAQEGLELAKSGADIGKLADFDGGMVLSASSGDLRFDAEEREAFRVTPAGTISVPLQPSVFAGQPGDIPPVYGLSFKGSGSIYYKQNDGLYVKATTGDAKYDAAGEHSFSAGAQDDHVKIDAAGSILATDRKLRLRDEAIFLHSPSDGVARLEADGEIRLDAPAHYFGDSADKVVADMANDDFSPVVNLGMDLGTSGERWSKLWGQHADLSGEVSALRLTSSAGTDIGGELVVGGTSYFTGNAQFEGTVAGHDGALDITGQVTASAGARVEGDMYVGSTSQFVGDAQFDGDVAIAGSLDVYNINTVSRTEEILEVSDARILAASGSDSTADNIGYLIGGADSADAVASMLWDTTASALDINIAAETQLQVKDGSILPGANNDVDLGSDALEFKDMYIDGIAYIDDIEVEGSAVIDTTLDVGGATDLAGSLLVTGSADMLSTLDVAGAVQMDSTLNADGAVTMGSTLGVTGEADFSAAILAKTDVKFYDDDASNYFSIEAPTDLAADYSLVFPGDDGEDGQVLMTDGSGNLTWDTPTSVTRKEHVLILGADVALDGNSLAVVDFSSPGGSDVVPSGYDAQGDLPADLSALGVNEIDVFVNGQLLVVGASYDYTISDVKEISFTFPLYIDDVITVKTRVSA